jgi:hypothetical protein
VTEAAVTALLPVKDYRLEYLREAVGSLMAQTSPRWRALVIHPARIGTQLATDLGEVTRDPRIEMVQEHGHNLAGALNTGMRAARTEFVAILFADDLWESRAVEVLERAIGERPDVDFFHSARRYIDDHGESISAVMGPRENVTLETFTAGGSIKHLLCWRCGFALQIGGIDETLESVGSDDWDFPWSMAETGARFGAIPECLYVYRDHRSGYRLTTHQPLRTWVRGTRRILRKHGVPRAVIRHRVAEARRTYLRQCLYSSRLDAWLKRLVRHDPARGWRENYR